MPPYFTNYSTARGFGAPLVALPDAGAGGLEGALRRGALELGGMESREVDRNLRIVHCFGRKMENRSVDRIGPSIAPLLQSPMLQGARRPVEAPAAGLCRDRENPRHKSTHPRTLPPIGRRVPQTSGVFSQEGFCRIYPEICNNCWRSAARNPELILKNPKF